MRLWTSVGREWWVHARKRSIGACSARPALAALVLATGLFGLLGARALAVVPPSAAGQLDPAGMVDPSDPADTDPWIFVDDPIAAGEDPGVDLSFCAAAQDDLTAIDSTVTDPRCDEPDEPAAKVSVTAIASDPQCRGGGVASWRYAGRPIGHERSLFVYRVGVRWCNEGGRPRIAAIRALPRVRARSGAELGDPVLARLLVLEYRFKPGAPAKATAAEARLATGAFELCATPTASLVSQARRGDSERLQRADGRVERTVALSQSLALRREQRLRYRRLRAAGVAQGTARRSAERGARRAMRPRDRLAARLVETAKLALRGVGDKVCSEVWAPDVLVTLRPGDQAAALERGRANAGLVEVSAAHPL